MAATLDELEIAIDRLIGALADERKKTRDLTAQVNDLQLQLARGPRGMEALAEENRRLRRNMTLAAEKVEEVIKKL